MKIWSVLLTLSLLLTFLGTAVTLAQDTTDPSEVTADEINEVARELWCPLCSGVRLDSCELQACTQMKEQIALKLAEGEDTESIKAYFIEQYGPQVLGQPPLEGFNWLAWLLPVIAVAGGGIFLIMRGRQLSTSPSPAQAASPAPEPTTDEYAQKLNEELKLYD